MLEENAISRPALLDDLRVSETAAGFEARRR